MPRTRLALALAAALPACLGARAVAAQDTTLPAKELPRVEVRDHARDDTPAKLDHLMKEVDDARITVTKKTTVTKLDQQPTVIGNNPRELLVRSPGLLVSEQQTPTQFNLSYRGIGNPQESEYTLVMQDGLPIMSDWIGFPTLYYLPLPQNVEEVQLIRGGSSLLYGPEPAPVVNFVSRRPQPGAPLGGVTENVVGSHNLVSSYNALEGTSGPWEFRADAAWVRSNGPRDNSDSRVRNADFYLGWRPDERQHWGVDLHAYRAEAGDAGRIGFPQWQANPDLTVTPANRNWVDRYSLVLSHEREFGDAWYFEGKAWTGYQDLASRSAAGFVAPQPPPSSTTLQDEQFRTSGTDLRVRHRWGRGNAFTAGTVLYHAEAPFRQWTSPDLAVDRYDRSGTPRLRQQRSSDYAAVFAENVFRLPHRIHIVPSVRIEHERVAVDESVRPPFLTRPLIDTAVSRTVPLFGLGIGNDFGHQNETYFNVSQGWRPLRYFDIASPFSNLHPGGTLDPSKSLSWEAGVHGTPITGLYYDASVFWIDFKNRIETQRVNATDVINVNSGDTRHRGFEGELSYDFLARGDSGRHLIAFASLSLLNARFTDSANPAQVGLIPAYAPRYLAKAGLTWRTDAGVKLSLTGVSVASQYWQDSNQPRGAGDAFLPARIPQYTVWDLAGDWQLTPWLRLLGGVANLGDKRYYARVWQTGLEPADGRTWYAGAALSF